MEPGNPTSAVLFSKPNELFVSKPNLLFQERLVQNTLRLTRMIVFFFFFFFQKFVPVTFVMWMEHKLFSRKGISWKQNDNLITKYEHKYSLLVPDFIYSFFQSF